MSTYHFFARQNKSSRGKNHRHETDSEQVPWGKDEKDFEKRVKKYVKPLKGKRMELAIRPARFSRRRAATRAPSIRMDEARAGAACRRRTSGGRASASLGAGRQGPEEGGPALAAGC